MPNQIAVQFEGESEFETSFTEWAADNNATPELVEQVRALPVGESVQLGGGAGVVAVVRVLS